jgi:hypothetical protein
MSGVLWGVSIFLFESTLDGDFLLFVLPFIYLGVTFFIDKLIIKSNISTMNTDSFSDKRFPRIGKFNFVRLFFISFIFSLPFIYWLGDTPLFAYSNRYGSDIHLLNGRFLPLPTMEGWILLIVVNFIITYLVLWLYRWCKYIFTLRKI